MSTINTLFRFCFFISFSNFLNQPPKLLCSSKPFCFFHIVPEASRVVRLSKDRKRRFFTVHTSGHHSQKQCNSSLFNQLWKTEAAETGVYSRILRIFQNSLPPNVINICILMRYQWWGVLEYSYLKYGDELASETHTNKIVNAEDCKCRFDYTQVHIHKNGIRLLQVMLEFRINNLDIKQLI